MKTEQVAKVRAPRRKVRESVTLFAAIEAEQHEALRAIAFSERRSLANVVREALAAYLAQHPAPRRLVSTKR